MSPSQDANQRVEKLFSDIKNIANQPVADSAGVLNANTTQLQSQVQVGTREYLLEIESLNARVRELETLLADAKKHEEENAARIAEASVDLKKNATLSAPLLYEKEQ